MGTLAPDSRGGKAPNVVQVVTWATATTGATALDEYRSARLSATTDADLALMTDGLLPVR